MGWKSTITISKEEAITAIIEVIIMRKRKKLQKLTIDKLQKNMDELGIGDNSDYPYFGYNFNIFNNSSDSNT